MLKQIIFPIFFLLFTFFIQAAEIRTDKNFIFINSDPIGAEVIINNDTGRNLQTPCVVRNINRALPLSIRIRKSGYKDYTLLPAEVKQVNLDISLTPISFDLFFPNETIFKINNSLTKGPLIISKLSSGTYNFIIQKNKIVFNKISNFTIAEAILGTALAFSVIWVVTSAILVLATYTLRDEAKTNGSSSDYNFYTQVYNNFIPVLGVSAGVTGIFGISFSSVMIADFVLRRKNKKSKFEVINTTSNDKTFFETSNIFLSQGEISKATKILQIFVTAYPDSNLMPQVYFQLGQNYFIEGDYENALKYWLIFKNKFPLIKYYDYVTKNISDIYYQNKEYKKALDELDKILYTSDSVSKNVNINENEEEITAYKAKLNRQLYTDTTEKKYFIATENYYNSLIDTFPDSEIIDIYFFKLLELYKDARLTDKINMLKKRAENLKTKNDKMKKIILSYF